MRDYQLALPRVKDVYMNICKYQTLETVKRLRTKYSNPTMLMSVQEAIDHLSAFVDSSDPDVNFPNKDHLYQTAEAMRRDNQPRWMQLTGLIHDLGKVVFLRGCSEDGTTVETQWGIVGDTFVVGFPESIPYPEYAQFHKTLPEETYSTGCGLDNCIVTYGHDEYMYQVLCNNKTSLPKEALSIIRYHSLYPWHSYEKYINLESEWDRSVKSLVKEFNKYDLYTKTDSIPINDRELLDYYNVLVREFLPVQMKW
jgi:inositol oxygenase